MAFFSDERSAELRELFFESAQELMQALNDEGLQLEQRPRDPEVIRNIRRTVHTLKGDSAACGFRELSELAHDMENVLTPEFAESANGSLAELVLSAADAFDSMLAAYRANGAPPSPGKVRELIQKLKGAPTKPAPPVHMAAPSFGWNEYETVTLQHFNLPGTEIYEVEIEVDRDCPMRMAALQLLRNVLQEMGTVLILHPEGDLLPDNVAAVQAAIASAEPIEKIENRLQIPSVTKRCVVRMRKHDQVSESIEVAARVPEEPVSRATPVVDVPAPGAATPRTPAQPEVPAEASAAVAGSSAPENMLRVDADRIDTVLDLVGELIIGKSMFNQMVSEFGKRFPKDPLKTKFADAMAIQAQVLNELQRSVMKIRMVPVEQLFRRFPRVVRDVAKHSGKEVELLLSGQDTDLDKSILDALQEPMMHLIRNAVDHGIEKPPERIAAGKPAKGQLKLNAFYQGNQVVIELSDDGRGIDQSKLVSKAVSAGVVTAEEASKLSEPEVLNLIFEPGLSTADAVTEVSGRGMGMDIVQNVLHRLKGTINIYTEPGQGTTFQLRVPLTLAIMQALLFHVGPRLYAVPLGSVLEITRATQDQIHVVDHHEVFQLRDQIITLVHLNKLDPKPVSSAPGRKRVFVIVVAMGEHRFGLIADSLVGEQELVIKALDDNLVATDLVSGASILGDGKVVLILNVMAVIESLGRTHRTAKRLGVTA